jgi:hypothetical protein
MPETADQYICNICDHICKDQNEYITHISDHRTFLNKKNAENAEEFNCKECNFKCSKKSNWAAHVATAKHRNRTFSNEKNAATKPTYKCSNCDKEYMAKNSLWYHTKKCTVNKKESLENQMKPFEVITDLLKQNKELHEQIIEISKEPKVVNNITNINNSNNNNTNNQFNLNMFLQEDCKNALNIMDFVRSLNLTVKDIEETGRLGFVDGMTRIFIKALKDMDITMRPIHCTDIKRETVYVKDQDTWEKDNNDKNKLKNALKHVARKNLELLPEWQEQNPDYRILDTPENQQYMQISLSSLGAYGQEESQKQDDKILKNVLKEVLIQKSK